MEKVALILLSTLILSGCSSYGMQGNSAAVQAGAAIGGVLGAIEVTGQADTMLRSSELWREQ